MIFYTLLPTEERRALRREYRLRISITLLLFLSCGVVLGIAALLPSYLHTYGTEREALQRQQELLRSRRESGADQIEKAVVQSQALAEKLLSDADKAIYSDILQKIISRRAKDILLGSFAVTSLGTTTSEIVLQGTAATRESLLAFKKSLESESIFSSIELPLSDLAKSRNIAFSMKVTVKKI